MRHHRHLRDARAQGNLAGGARANERIATPPRAGRGRLSRRARPGVRASPAVDHRGRDRPAAAVQRGRQRRRHLQRRDLQLPGADPRAHRPRPRVPHPQRHRGHRARVGGLGRGMRRAFARDVRVRAVGPEPRNTLPRSRPVWRQAALLCVPPRRQAHLRLRDEIAPRARRLLARARSLRDRGVFRAGLRAGAADGLRRHREAAARAHVDGTARSERRRPEAILGCAIHARQSAVRGRRVRGARRAAAGVGSPAPHFGGPARRVPLRAAWIRAASWR